MKTKTKINVAIFCGIAAIALTITGAVLQKFHKERKRQDSQAAPGFTTEEKKIDRGIITRLWIEPAHTLSRKNLETNTWEYADFPESYWMELTDTATGRVRILSIAKLSYDIYIYNYNAGIKQFTQIFDDTASYNANQRKSSAAAEQEAEQARLVIIPEPTLNPRERDSLK